MQQIMEVQFVMRQVIGYHKDKGIFSIPFLGCILFIVICLTACNPLEKEKVEQITTQDQLAEWKTCSPKEIEEHITVELSDSYRLDGNIMLSEQLENYQVKNINLTRHVYEDVESVVESWTAYCGKIQDSDMQKFDTGECLENGEMIQSAGVKFLDEGSSGIQVDSISALMYGPLMYDYDVWRLKGMYNRQRFGRTHYEYAEQSIENALLSETQILEAKENLESIFGVEFMEDYDVYTYTQERLEEILTWEKSYVEAVGSIYDSIRWDITEADEATILCFKQGYEGIPILHDEPSMSSTGARWIVKNYCMLAVSREGIEGLDLLNPYEIKGEAEAVEILSFGEFIEKHMESRAGLDTTVVNIGLYYVPVYSGEGLDFTTRLVWYVQTEEQKEGDLFRDSALYDAVTGEQILW